jgi:DUF1680 family protein
VKGPVRGQVDAEVTGGFWAQRMATNRDAIALGQQRLEDVGSLGSLRVAAGEQDGVPSGQTFRDSDVYKWLEAVAWDGSRLDTVAQLTKTIAAAQHEDGYLNSVVQDRYTRLGTSHEHYCAGHLFQAAVAASRATGDRDLLAVATRFADHLASEFGPDKRTELDGHPGVETALVELFRETGERRYLDLARHFVDSRGHGHATPPGDDLSRYVDRIPVRAAETVEGHAVRAVYFAAGATDVAIEDGDDELLSALRRQFDSMRREKQYVTGSVGARWDGEAFGDPYELPPDRSYSETCAGIGVLQWAWRLLLATGEAQYADQAEWALYNAVLPGVSLDGADYFYVNTLQRRTDARADLQRSPAHGRRPWFNCSCCPPNVMRTLASLPGYLATGGDDSLTIQLYAPATITAGELTVDVETEYPWDGRITVTVRKAPPRPVELALRVPDWADGSTVDGAPVVPGYARLRREFRTGDRIVLDLPMPARLLTADHRVDAVRGCVAVARGPLVYALEQPDQEPILENLRIDSTAEIRAEHRPDLLGGITVLHADGAPTPLTLIPYYAWANRGQHAMRVWIPT